MSKTNGPVRRAQLITPFGVGALMVSREGTGMITAGLDHWYEREDKEVKEADVKLDDFEISEWRLEKLLDVDHFRLPPDFRTQRRYQEDIPNLYLTIPFLRFPQAHFCSICDRLNTYPLNLQSPPKCEEGKDCRGKRMSQVPFVAMCEDGHIQDFPWREWVHKNHKPQCEKQLYLRSYGEATLAGQKVECKCGAMRDLGRIMKMDNDGTTFLSKNLAEDDDVFLCEGKKPWLDDENGLDECNEHLKGTLRSASNVYFPILKSSIFVPHGDERVGELMAKLQERKIQSLLNTLESIGELNVENFKDAMEGNQPKAWENLKQFSDEEIREALKKFEEETTTTKKITDYETMEEEKKNFRWAEYEIFKDELDNSDLIIREMDLKEYSHLHEIDLSFSDVFSKVMLVKRLKETRSLCGFTRITPDYDFKKMNEYQKQLRRNQLHPKEDWLSAYQVYGEGIFLDFNLSRLKKWEDEYSKNINQRITPVRKELHNLVQDGRANPRNLTPRFFLIHTFAHILINQLVFECGYSSASLRERLYVSFDEDYEMAGVLIYTAAGDSEGTMGGLVRMGKPGNIEAVMEKALAEAQWCSVDPVCMEMAELGGQGPNSCNLAACHNCSLVPETTCEEFNRFLDRGLVIGNIKNNDLGFFTFGKNTG